MNRITSMPPAQEPCIPFSLKQDHQKILQCVLGIILLAGITTGILGIVGYLPPLAGYVSSALAVIALVALVLVSCAHQTDKISSETSAKKTEVPKVADRLI